MPRSVDVVGISVAMSAGWRLRESVPPMPLLEDNVISGAPPNRGIPPSRPPEPPVATALRSALGTAAATRLAGAAVAQVFGTDTASASNAESPMLAETAVPPEPSATALTIVELTDGTDAAAVAGAAAAWLAPKPQLIAPVDQAEVTIAGEIVAPEACSRVCTIGGGV